MSTFYENIEVDNIHYELQFEKIQLPGSCKFFITAKNSLSQPASFEMQSSELGEWKVVEPSPTWVKENEKLLAAIIRAKS
jgi:hypothetical protein